MRVLCLRNTELQDNRVPGLAEGQSGNFRHPLPPTSALYFKPTQSESPGTTILGSGISQVAHPVTVFHTLDLKLLPCTEPV